MRQISIPRNNTTLETIHPSVFEQAVPHPVIQDAVSKNPQLLANLLPLEEEMKKNWPYVPGKNDARVQEAKASKSTLQGLAGGVVKSGQAILSKITQREDMKTESGAPVMEKNWIGKLADDPHLASFVKALN
jgi:hypothetical protein